ncbi:MAG: roadblock/LC7 domain-containing protein [Methanomicrobiales archaeon]|jgi:predicted regulator of Ras-like GTPase activity (Roadblock/LC7/MglB family)|nr:roadblock/LC7 domain-containing protein [Methanomicrobiales archaeon]
MSESGEEREERTAELNRLLHAYMVIDGVLATVLVQHDGVVRGSVITGPVDRDALATVISFVMEESRGVARAVGDRDLSMVFVEFSERVLLTFPIHQETYLVIIGGLNTNIASVQQAYRRFKGELGALV